MRGEAEIVFELERPELLFQALSPEMEDVLHKGSVQMEIGPGQLEMRIKAENLVSLRAALNTWIRLVKIGWEMVNI